MSENKIKNRIHIPRANFKIILVTVALTLIAVVAAVRFSYSYTNLNNSIQSERVDSVEQIGKIILEKIELLSHGYSSELAQSARLLSASNVDTVESARNQLGETEDLYILRDDGSCYDLNKNPIYLLDVQQIYSSITAGETGSVFGSVRTKGDYWMFFTPLEDVVLDDMNLIGLLKLVDAQTYAHVTTNTIFGNQGATYVVSPGGVILLHPENSDIDTYFKSYNMLSEMRENGASQEDIEMLQNALEHDTDAQIVTEFGDTTWLIQSVSDESNGQNIVLTVPISITAKDTFDSMQMAMFSMIFLIVVLGLLTVVWIFFFIRRNGEMKLEQAKASSKSDFMNKVSHDIRTPLNAIVGMLEIAQRSKGNTQMVEKSLADAKKSSEYLISIINDVLDMSRIENGKMSLNYRTISLKKLLDGIMQLEMSPAAEKNIELHLEDKTDSQRAYKADDLRIKQCLINLISNSIKFTPAGGTVMLTCEEQQLADGYSIIRFCVEDTGIGMSDEFMEHMFSPFEQEQSIASTGAVAGSGLGLSIVHSLITMMGGSIDVKSKKDEGSVFVIELPLEETEPEEDLHEEISDAPTELLRGRRVLVAEDNDLNRSIVVFFLEDMGIHADTAENGEKAVESFVNSEEGYYDLILMDIQMPVLGGLDASKQIRDCGRTDALTVPIIALSANAFHEDAEKSYEAGMQAHLSKPINPDELQATLIKFIGGTA